MEKAQAEPPLAAPTFTHEPDMFDDDAWFESTAIPEGAVFTTFTTAKDVKAKVDEDPWINSPTQPAHTVGFQAARAIATRRDESPESDFRPHSSSSDPPESSPPHLGRTSTAAVGFKPASAMEAPQFVGFKTANNAAFAPSAKALKEAELKRKQWDSEFEADFKEDDAPAEGPSSTPVASTSKVPDTLFAASQDGGGPESPTPARFSGFKPAGLTVPPPTNVPSIQTGKKPFKSPLLPA